LLGQAAIALRSPLLRFVQPPHGGPWFTWRTCLKARSERTCQRDTVFFGGSVWTFNRNLSGFRRRVDRYGDAPFGDEILNFV
jgi:hypothetical protein